MLTNAAITLYHKQYDPAMRLDAWTRTVYANVNWYAKNAVATDGSGLEDASSVIVRIPTTHALAVAPGDQFLYGITNAAVPPKSACCLVVSVTDNRRGSAAMQHFKIEGK